MDACWSQVGLRSAETSAHPANRGAPLRRAARVAARGPPLHARVGRDRRRRGDGRGIGRRPAGASAVIAHLRDGHALSYQPLRHAALLALTPRVPADQAFSNLDYNGGPVMPSNTNYTVYWDPAGAPRYPTGYESGVDRYLEDLAHDSGSVTNVDSVSTQYGDAAGQAAAYASHFGGELSTPTPTPPTAARLRRSASPTPRSRPS